VASPITTVIVDDEPLAREVVRTRLKSETDIKIVGEAVDGPGAVKMIRALQPDLVFLDVQMPAMDGFEVIEQVSSDHLPIVVFVTAYDRYALKAFEAQALDYLLKPFTTDRFQTALERARTEIAKAGELDTHRRLIELLDARQHGPQTREGNHAIRGEGPLLRFAVKHNQRIVLVKVDDVDWIESSANYARLHARGTPHMVRMTMSELEKRLDPVRFARIHRSTIVQVDRIKDIAPAWHGDFDVTLRDGTVLRLSRSFRGRLVP
jgi:two-component system, LytTR family, response regulator